MKTTTARKKKAPYGPNIVRAWFDTVFRYALRGLDSERGFLLRKNWTYRCQPPSLEFLGPLREHLPGAWDNLEQFVSFFPKIGSLIDRHDASVETLLDECKALHASIMSSSRLPEVFRTIAAEVPSTLGGDVRSHFGAYSQDEQFVALLAEHLVNNLGELPSHYATCRLWNRYRGRLVAVLDDPLLAAQRARTEEAGAKLLDAVDALSAHLRQTRDELSLEFDVPLTAEVAGVR